MSIAPNENTYLDKNMMSCPNSQTSSVYSGFSDRNNFSSGIQGNEKAFMTS
jgi:hypothetical protein